MTPEEAAVTIIIPCGGHHWQFVADAVKSCMDSSEVPEAVIVIDDASDQFYALPAYENLRVIRHRHAGRSAARNLATKEATTEWLFFLDADDLLEPTAIPDFRHHLEANRQPIGFLYADYDYLDGDGQRRRVEKEPFRHMKVRPMDRNYFNIGMFVRRTRFEEVGGFDEGMVFGEYWDFALRYLRTATPLLVIKNDRPFILAGAYSSVAADPAAGMESATGKIQAMIRGGYYDRPILRGVGNAANV